MLTSASEHDRFVAALLPMIRVAASPGWREAFLPALVSEFHD